MFLKLLHITLACLFTVASYAHGDLHKRIVKTSEEIKNHPDSAFLYLKRGELYFQHEEYPESVKDFKACSKLGYESDRLDLGLAKSYERMGKMKEALTFLDKILEQDAQYVKAWRCKGRVLFKTGSYAASGECFEKVLEYVDQPITENYFEASQAWEKMGTEEGIAKANQVIGKGMLELGELLVFYDRLVEINLNAKNYNAALAAQTQIIEKSNRKERPYYRRALIYMEKNDTVSAHSDLENARKAIEKLPARIKNNKAILELKSDLEELLKK